MGELPTSLAVIGIVIGVCNTLFLFLIVKKIEIQFFKNIWLSGRLNRAEKILDKITPAHVIDDLYGS